MKYSIAILFLLLQSLLLHAQSTKVKIETTMGNIVVMLYDDAPKHKANFIKLANEHSLDSTLFHRVIKNFVIQGGDPTSKRADSNAKLGEGDLGYLVDAEIMPEKHLHKRGALGAARDDIPSKASSACQFYFVIGKVYSDDSLKAYALRRKFTVSEEQRKVYTTVGGTPHLDGKYTVFGEVTKGMDIVEAINAVKTNADDRPLVNVRILKVRVVQRKHFLGLF
jgi:cyclophilin family peptidyl-prolyl cis-trans isomerase